MKTITFDVDRGGQVRVEVNGVQGPACKDLTLLFSGLGKVTGEELKADYYETPLRENLEVKS